MAIRKAVGVFLVMPLLLCFAMLAICQDEDNYDEASTEYDYPVDDYESSEFGLGTVVSIVDSAITLSEDGYGEEADSEVIYIVDEKTKFSNINSLGEIKKGSVAYIDYIEKDGKKLILTIDIESEEIE